jgi:hypothetical protein
VSRERRWDTDERGHGVADAAAIAPFVDELRELVTRADWVTEDPELHLLPHIRQVVDGEPSVTLVATRVENGAFEVDLEYAADASPGATRALAHRIVSGFAETTTLVRQSANHDHATFEVVTGTPPGGSVFATHGHWVTIRIRVIRP